MLYYTHICLALLLLSISCRQEHLTQKQHYHHLHQYHSGKHTERIDRGISRRRNVALQTVVAIIKRHRIGHTSAQHSRQCGKIHLEELGSHISHYQHRNYGKQKTENHPHSTLGTENHIEELSTGIKPQACQI